MPSIRETFNTICLTGDRSLIHWNQILNFFRDNKQDLDEKEIKILLDIAEECRIVFNESSREPINKNEMNPDADIYKHYDSIK